MRVVIGTFIGLLAMQGAAAAQADCADLWYERNAIYKDAGYCFRTAAAIREFGNAGCRYVDQRDVPLSQNQRARIADIVRVERMNGCAR